MFNDPAHHYLQAHIAAFDDCLETVVNFHYTLQQRLNREPIFIP